MSLRTELARVLPFLRTSRGGEAGVLERSASSVASTPVSSSEDQYADDVLLQTATPPQSGPPLIARTELHDVRASSLPAPEELKALVAERLNVARAAQPQIGYGEIGMESFGGGGQSLAATGFAGHEELLQRAMAEVGLPQTPEARQAAQYAITAYLNGLLGGDKVLNTDVSAKALTEAVHRLSGELAPVPIAPSEAARYVDQPWAQGSLRALADDLNVSYENVKAQLRR